MRTIISSTGTLLLSAAILLAGGGLFSTLIAIRAQGEGFGLLAIGLMSSTYFGGFISGCFLTPHLVKRVGHIRVFAALSALVAAAALLHAIFIHVFLWLLLRLITGFSFAGLYILIESWINEQAPNNNRAQILSIYRMVDLCAVMAGQFMLILASPDSFILFSVVAICVCLAIFPISLSASKAPVMVNETSLNLKKVWALTPLAIAGCFTVGMTNGVFWGMAPIFVQKLGHPLLTVSAFMSITIASGALWQWPIGMLSDKYGRRFILILVTIGACLSGLFLWHFSLQSTYMMFIGAGFYGLFSMQLFGLCAAHANDYAKASEFVTISSSLLLIYGLGSVIGPALAPIVMNYAGPSAMFAFTASVHIILSLYAIYTHHMGKAEPQRDSYVAIPRPRTFTLMMRTDPRNPRKRKKKPMKDPLS